MDVHTYISGIGRGVLRKNPAKNIANSVFIFVGKFAEFTPIIPPPLSVTIIFFKFLKKTVF